METRSGEEVVEHLRDVLVQQIDLLMVGRSISKGETRGSLHFFLKQLTVEMRLSRVVRGHINVVILPRGG